MASRKPKQSGKSAPGDRVAYSEFGSHNAAFERALPELPPNQQTLKLQVTRKGRGGKTVTVISGFQLRPDSLSALAKQLKSHCGSGGTVKDQTIEIQGEHAQTLLPLLIQQGYKAKISGG